jgi:hypothetical protein
MAQINIKQIRGASQGSILFLGTNSVVKESTDLQWDDLNSVLSVNGNLKISDGNEQEGYVLTSDADGFATWQPVEGSKWTGVTAISRDSDVDVYGRFTVATTSFPGEAIFRIEGSAGELFTIVDSLTGSLFSVNDISGLPVFEVFDDFTILFGDYLAPGLITTKYNSVSPGTSSLYDIPTLEYDGAFIEYVARSGANLRSGSIMAVWSATSSFNFTETSVGDIGDTSGVTFGFTFSGDNITLQSSIDSGTWIIKTIIRSI